jgi:hypothetical protein
VTIKPGTRCECHTLPHDDGQHRWHYSQGCTTTDCHRKAVRYVGATAKHPKPDTGSVADRFAPLQIPMCAECAAFHESKVTK